MKTSLRRTLAFRGLALFQAILFLFVTAFPAHLSAAPPTNLSAEIQALKLQVNNLTNTSAATNAAAAQSGASAATKASNINASSSSRGVPSRMATPTEGAMATLNSYSNYHRPPKSSHGSTSSSYRGPSSSAGQLAIEIDKLHGQVGKLTSGMKNVEAAAKPLVDTGKAISGKVQSFPDRVTAFRQKYGIPLKNPTIDEEWLGIQRYMLEKGGMSPRQAQIMSAKMAKTPIVEHLKQPFRPTSIAMAVGINAGMNILQQVKSGQAVDLGSAMSFVTDQKFWGGMVGSGVAYGVASYVASALLPPGVGVIAALLPTFAGMFASTIGWELGASEGKSFNDVLKNIDWASTIGQAAGSSLGIILGGQLALVMFAGLGTIAGPLGAIAGALILGPLGAKIASFFRDFLMGDKEGLKKAEKEMNKFLQKTDKVVDKLTQAGYIPTDPEVAQAAETDAKASELKARYSDLYEQFVQAHKENRAVEAVAILKELRTTKEAFNSRLRKVYGN